MNGIVAHKKKTNPGLRKEVNEMNFKTIFPYLPKGENKLYLDAGCGEGDFSELVAKKLKLQKIYGVDVDESLFKVAKNRKIIVKKADIQKKIPFPNNYFDVILSRQVIEHLLDPDSFLKECYRVLKDIGVLVITTPNLACWFNRIIFIFGIQPFFLETSTEDKTVGLSFTRSLTPMREPLGHIRVFTLGALKDLLEMHGFEIIKVKGGKVRYLPFFMTVFDTIFSFLPNMASDLIVVARKNVKK